MGVERQMADKVGMRTGVFSAFADSAAPRSLTWSDLLALAEAPEGVVAIARDFLATWDPWEIEALPAECKPPRYFSAPEDIVGYAFTLARSDRAPGADDRGVQRMTHFFADAAQRIALLMSDAPPPAAPNDP
jgi:hypothetical protein